MFGGILNTGLCITPSSLNAFLPAGLAEEIGGTALAAQYTLASNAVLEQTGRLTPARDEAIGRPLFRSPQDQHKTVPLELLAEKARPATPLKEGALRLPL